MGSTDRPTPRLQPPVNPYTPDVIRKMAAELETCREPNRHFERSIPLEATVEPGVRGSLARQSAPVPLQHDSRGTSLDHLENWAMQQIQHLSLTWMHRPAREMPEQRLEPLALPDRGRIRRLAEVYHAQMTQARRETGRVDEIARQQVEALRQFMIELTEADANTFINRFTEESSAVERAWLARRRAFQPQRSLSPTLLGALALMITIVAVGLAIIYVV